MSNRDNTDLTADLILRAYSVGVFPMAQSRDDPSLLWLNPEHRGVMPLDQFHISRSLMKCIRQGRFTTRCNTAFSAVMQGCAEETATREKTWINHDIFRLYNELHELGAAHSVECWRDDQLVGGLYGVSLGGAFFGESMFSRETNASKVAMVQLAARLRLGGFSLLDAQFLTDHLAQFGAFEVARTQYLELLDIALHQAGQFYCDPDPGALSDELESMFRQSRTHTS